MTVESVCHNCDKPWPLECQCEGNAQRPRPVGYLPRGPGIEHVVVEAELAYRERLYRARGTYAIQANVRPVYSKPDLLEMFRAGSHGWESIPKPSMTLRLKATSDLRLALDMELRRRNPSWHDRLFARREAGLEGAVRPDELERR